MRTAHLACTGLLLAWSGFAPDATASTATLESGLARCMAVVTDTDRLRCFEALARTAGANQQTGVPAPAIASDSKAPAETPGPLTEAWQLELQAGRDSIDILPYRTSHVMPITYGDRTNTAPFQDVDNPLEQEITLQKEEAQFQLSFKLRLVDNLLGEDGDVWFGYTQRSFWQVYNKAESRPFRETNYEPELMLTFPVDYRVMGVRGGLLGVSLNHQSNGRNDPLSRSWNRLVGMAGFETANFSLLARAWYRIPEASADDDNPHITDYMGNGDLLAHWRLGEHDVEALLKSNFDPGNLKAGLQLSWSFPIPGTRAIRWYLQYYYGYGESMIDQEFLVNRVGIGVALAGWY
jgi:phospholipase A1/A2